MSRCSEGLHRAEWMVALVLIPVMLPAVRAAAETVLPSIYWRNTVTFPSDAFRAAASESGDPGWIKFLIFTSDPTKVYFQDSKQYRFHYDFATALVSEYIGMTAEQFDHITLYAQGQKAILGSVILPYWTSYQPAAEQIQEYGIQLVRQDAYDPAQVVTLFNLVQSKVVAAAGVQAYYFPSYEQIPSAEEDRQYLADHGVEVSSTSRWAKGNVAYARGWALGTLKKFPAAGIGDAYRSGLLAPDDILLTDGIPAEVPIVAGIATLAPATPSSHVAILANTYGIPFVYLALPDDAARAEQLVGRQIALRAYGPTNDCDARLIDVQDTLTPQQIEEILALKVPAPLEISPVSPFGAYSAPADGLWPADIRYFGGKAANFGLIRRSIPANSPVATALSFDLWNDFLGQTLPNGRTLRAEIDQRLAGVTYPPANMSALSATLESIREDLFKRRSATSFSPAAQREIIAILQDPQYRFEPDRNIRFRSSTNVEDSEQFTGAGLYDSFSGCLADDLDDDELGPSRCDASEPDERGVFRAIRKVFASFYNDNAFLARLRYGLDENQVGMALLVHHSTPDQFELANGVATLVRNGPSQNQIALVTQKGAVSVTNPGDGSIPEEVQVQVYSFGSFLTLVGYSNLVPLGATVLSWETEYRNLSGLLLAAGNAFAAASGKSRFTLDFEYKKVLPDGTLWVKQVRELPQASTTASITPFLIGEPAPFTLFQGEYADVFANHRLKSEWTVTTRSMWLTEANLAAGLYADVAMECVDSEGDLRTLTGLPSDWPEASHDYADNAVVDSWSLADMGNPRRYTLRVSGAGDLVAPSQCPLLTIRDLGLQSGFGAGVLELQVDHDRPVPSWTWSGAGTTSTDHARLIPPFEPQPGDELITRKLIGPKGVSATTQYYWPVPPGGIAAGYTAPLARFVETQIAGYTTTPIVLHGFYAQTYKPEHHNFGEHFIFEPGLEPDLSPSIPQQLRDRNIRLIHVYSSLEGTATFTTYGFVPPGDLDQDGDVDGTDLAIFRTCVTGPVLGPVISGCRSADFDDDRDVDQDDFGAFQRTFTGSK
ncbi:MAG TPA: PEP/pyruvate-binding domain-containing protein [Phycisphaerae bacterium]|nr:PEP/pyruvate-binding domain-containing protein [Phycisphaerae bacterium]HRY68630.1 PEP/pyruvate-binding domain-containing protein [Phycisphaerae bacterium]HSA25456.1 PEP/pyruvate-binding domain-containing protein [Phycisphaerae bacterium]